MIEILLGKIADGAVVIVYTWSVSVYKDLCNTYEICYWGVFGFFFLFMLNCNIGATDGQVHYIKGVAQCGHRKKKCTNSVKQRWVTGVM